MTTLFTQRHYVALALMLKNASDREQAATTARTLADYFEKLSPKFKRDLFLRACDLQSGPIPAEIKWVSDNDSTSRGFWYSADDRFHIAPAYCGRTTPQFYRVRDRREGYEFQSATFDTVRECKAWAADRVHFENERADGNGAEQRRAELRQHRSRPLSLTRIRIVSDGDIRLCTLGDAFPDADEMQNVLRDLKQHGEHRYGGGASPLAIVTFPL